MSVLHITKENFVNEVLNSDRPVLVDFWGQLVRPLPHGEPSGG